MVGALAAKYFGKMFWNNTGKLIKTAAIKSILYLLFS